jgi:membrane peptidoglycan carboxypeptidase
VSRDVSQGRTHFLIKDENSTNGIYRRKRRITTGELRHGDVFTLGPPELAAAVRLQYVDPPPLYVRAASWSAYGIGGVTALLALAIGIEWFKFSVWPLPTSSQGPVIVYARDGETPLRQSRTTAHVDMKQLSEFSPYLSKAVVASEDSRFYWHLGVDPIGILRAVVVNLRGGGFKEGASTVTQQVARSLFRDYVGAEDSAARKLREMVVALKLETFYSKNFLLLTYLNRIYVGGDTSGFEDASRYYFEKSAKDLTLSEASTLVGILPAPNAFNFCGDEPSRQRAITYRDRVIKRMLAQGKVKLDEANRARRSPIEVSRKVCEEQANTIAPYFYSYVFQELEYLLGEQLAREGNFIVETQLDPQAQAQAEAALRNTVSNTGGSYNFSQGAVVTLDSSTGGVIALTGGTDYKNSQFNRATQAKRQPGSTFKLFTYTAAVDRGISPGKIYSCAPLTWRGQPYRGCERTGGSADMYTGIALSENAIALRVAQDVGLDSVVRMARKLGIESPLNPVPGLVLGQSETSVLEMTGAFGAIANNGVWNRPHLISRILDSSDCGKSPNGDRSVSHQNLKTCRVIYSFDQSSGSKVQAIRPDVAEVMAGMLRGVVARGTGRSASIGLGEEAGKTGTTNNNVDLWFIGFIPSRQMVTGVWLGNDNNSPTSGSSAQAARLWANYMSQVQ